MGWEEIDFNLIQSGMITRGGRDEEDNPLTQVSFTDYLNVFSRALDERLNMTTGYTVGTVPTLPNIIFEAGEIRNNIFWDKYRSLLSGYWSIYKNSQWVKTEVLNGDNRNDSTQFDIEDQDIIDLIGQEVFDIFENLEFETRLNMFRADVINALYSLYGFLTLRRQGKAVATEISGQRANEIYGFRITNNRDLLRSVSGSGYGSTAQSAIDDIYADEDARDFFYEVGSSLYICYINVARISKTENDPVYDARANYVNGNVAYLYSEDMQGNKLSMDYYPCDCVIEANYIYNTPDEGEDSFIQPPYAPDLPFVGFTGTALGFIEPKNISQTAEGTRHRYYYGEDENLKIPFPPTPTTNGDNNGKLLLRMPLFLVDVNNSALEFSI